MEGAAAWEEIARTVAMTCRNLAGAAAPTSQIERDAKFPIKWFQRRVPPNFASDPLALALPVAPAVLLRPSFFPISRVPSRSATFSCPAAGNPRSCSRCHQSRSIDSPVICFPENIGSLSQRRAGPPSLLYTSARAVSLFDLR